MSSQLVRELPVERAYGSPRARLVSLLGPLTVVAGIIWAIVQPYRLTLLHPHGQGFWWLLSEPPFYVILVGILFWRVIAPGLLEDMEAEAGE